MLKKPEGIFSECEVIVWGEKEAQEVYNIGSYGKLKDDHLVLSLVEALYLMEKGKLEVKDKRGSVFTKERFFRKAVKVDREFPFKYVVYRDLRERGFLVRTGFKFGTHFRVYERGVKLKKGPKSAKEHTKWIVHAVPENYKCSFPELSRAVRLAHNIRARMLWAVVDEEDDVTYYKIERIKP
ncbi:MAG: tRNA-intron lyase [Candidatus Aenigmatarchaeota archaeon]|nr:MAG: tRNA-intron lyase [Candidatus Aenigmarchaeota archaeon]